MSVIRVLVVDDFQPLRRFVSSLVERESHLQVVGEASDGLDAILKAHKLQPDLILLDINLPILNGIETARRIRQFSSNSKIVFLSADNSLDVVKKALSTGAQGYVCKANVLNELPLAVDAVLGNEQFVSSGVRGYQLPDGPRRKPLTIMRAGHPQHLFRTLRGFFREKR